MILQELRDKRNKLLSDAQVIMLDKENLTAEKRTQVNAMLADVDVIEGDITTHERLAKFEAERRSSRAIPRSQPGDAQVSDSDTLAARQKVAFDKLIRGDQSHVHLSAETRDRFAQVEVRDLITTSTGGDLVPQAFLPILTEAQKAWGDLLDLVNIVKSDTGAPTKYAMSDDTSSVMYEETEGAADANSAEDPVLTGATITCSMLSTPPVLASWAELQDSAFNIDDFVKNILGKRWYRSLSAMIVNGSTSGNIGTLIGTGTSGVSKSGYNVTSAVSGTVSYVDIATLYGSLDPAYEPNATFVMNSTTRATLLGEVDTLGRPIFLIAPVAGADAFTTLLGRPVKLVQALPNIAAGNFPILYGDFKQGYVLKQVNPGLSVVVLKERYADQFCTGYVPYGRAGGVFITQTGPHPIMGLKVHA